ncbi:plastocyanin/azurin family copper-binding protein [Haloarcula marina]|uniref:plastocyanin/azurin family copper-binding protein n=1 Tax=Haloarcula marina TaxID=2961574 RepID=UPI0020B8A88F|nr:plastocyanin/azurin family copper-binding protein [Halomicroarcula marina]
MEQSRRSFLAAMATGVTGALAGCGGGSESPTDAGTPTATDAATDTPTPTATATDAPTETATDAGTATPSATPTPTPDVAQRVLVGPGDFVFEPATFSVPVGSTVLWEWRGSNHNVKAETTPDGSEWTGTPGDAGRTFSSGHTYAYTFDVPGEYAYYCAPHRSLDMAGSFTVTE